MRPGAILTGAALLLAATSVVVAQRTDAFQVSRDHAAIRYTTTPPRDPVALLNRRLEAGEKLAFDPVSGYLRAVLDALKISTTSQMLVFSPTSAQADHISFLNPRALYFNDAVAVGWVRGTEVLELAAQDPTQGSMFYTLKQSATEPPRFTRNTDTCLACHLTWDTLAVPGLTSTSMYPLPDDKNAYANGFTVDQRNLLSQRWGGWFVTGQHGGGGHMGNLPVLAADKGKSKITAPTRPLASLTGIIDLNGFPTPYSDVVSLLVFNHQTHMANLITRLGWEARLTAAEPANAPRIREAAVDLVDYMLFVGEAPFAGRVQGAAGFTDAFTALGPKDSKGRSLREFDLVKRVFKYPCSYMIYSDAFEALPATAKAAAYDRLAVVLSGRDRAAKYRALTAADRQAVLEILRETKKDFPAS
ncbi:MAG: hypothetical protein ABL986_18060 [Vicinamibacterales bacterium]